MPVDFMTEKLWKDKDSKNNYEAMRLLTVLYGS